MASYYVYQKLHAIVSGYCFMYIETCGDDYPDYIVTQISKDRKSKVYRIRLRHAEI